jgi:hypothetical protein
VSPDVVPYQNSPFFVSAIDAAPCFQVGFLAGPDAEAAPFIWILPGALHTVVEGKGRGGGRQEKPASRVTHDPSTADPLAIQATCRLTVSHRH